jgi:hypothetical protein
MRNEKIYRTDRAQQIAAQAEAVFGWRKDSAPSLFLQRELQDIEAQAYRTPFAPLDADRLIPIRNIARGAQESGYDRITHYGMAKWVGSNGQDIARVNATRRRFTFPVRSMALSYVYSQDEIDAAAMAGVPLNAEYAMATRQGIDSFRNQVAMIGDASVSMTGLLNNANVPVGNATYGSWATNAVSNPDRVIFDLNDIWIDIWTLTKKVFVPDTIAIPVDLYGLISSSRVSTVSDTTILEFFLRSQKVITTVEPILECSGAGVGATNRMLCYKKDPTVLEQAVAIAFEVLPPQFVDLEVKNIARGRTGGTNVKVPIAMSYRDGI